MLFFYHIYISCVSWCWVGSRPELGGDGEDHWTLRSAGIFFLMPAWYENWRTNIKRRDINSGGAQSSIWLAWKRCLVFIVWEGRLLPSLLLLLAHIYLSTLGVIFTNACSTVLSTFPLFSLLPLCADCVQGCVEGMGFMWIHAYIGRTSRDGDVMCGENEEVAGYTGERQLRVDLSCLSLNNGCRYRRRWLLFWDMR